MDRQTDERTLYHYKDPALQSTYHAGSVNEKHLPTANKQNEHTWLSTSIAMSMNMSWSSLIDFSNFIMSLCLASISFSDCFACCVSVMIWTPPQKMPLHSNSNDKQRPCNSCYPGKPRSAGFRTEPLGISATCFCRPEALMSPNKRCQCTKWSGYTDHS